MEKWFLVRYEVRNIGAIGIFWVKEDTVLAHDSILARTMFRQRWGYKYEFRFPISCKETSCISL